MRARDDGRAVSAPPYRMSAFASRKLTSPVSSAKVLHIQCIDRQGCEKRWSHQDSPDARCAASARNDGQMLKAAEGCSTRVPSYQLRPG